ncbi:hypothetical protein DdX_06645 [Ditylenchus destructor]|uniref:7TM GPCR serpentine receptor class x (Srx) domain-containing protein n=1 Tax=Ditylenchus destructor TaxID=166010 RepID=A0AAD4NBE7_9BILA|nr:hypothetical protein DdX_06645 [Ditylenchus destructor]
MDELANKALLGSVMLLCSGLPMCLYFYVLCSVYKTAHKYNTFILIFSHGVADMCVLIQILWLSLEIICGQLVPVPDRINNYILRVSFKTAQLNFILIALNRAHSILSPLTYTRIWTRKFSIGSVLFCWSCVIIVYFYIYIINSFTDIPMLLHSIDKLGFTQKYTTSQTPSQVDRYLYLGVILASMAVYTLALLKLFWEWLNHFKRSTNVLPVSKCEAGERIRLFFVCFLSSIPFAFVYFLAYNIPHSNTNTWSFMITILHSFVYSCNAYVLIGLSKLVRKNLPFLPAFARRSLGITSIRVQNSISVTKPTVP